MSVVQAKPTEYKNVDCSYLAYLGKLGPLFPNETFRRASCTTYTIALYQLPRMAKASILHWRPWLFTAIAAVIACTTFAEPLLSKKIGQLSVPEIEDALQVGIHHPFTTPKPVVDVSKSV